MSHSEASFRRARRRRGVYGLGQWVKIISIVATAFGILWTAYTYVVESDVRSFEQRQKAWAMLNEHAREERCLADEHLASVPHYHTNSGQIDAIEFLVKQRTSLSGVGLPCSEFGQLRASHGSFSNAGFWWSNFTLAEFDYADLTLTDLDHSTLDNASFAGAKMTGARLHGVIAPEVDFTGADLTGLRASGSDFRGAVFKNAILKDTILNRARLTDADFTDAKFQNVSFTDACYVPHPKNADGSQGKPIAWPANIGDLKVCPPDWNVQLDDID